MRTFIFILIASISCSLCTAQFKQIAEGPQFDEPTPGYAKLLQLKNGSTFFAHVTMDAGINIRIYDAAHIERKVTSIHPNYGDLNERMRDKVLAVFEINKDVVFFVYHTNEKIPTLYRLIVDGSTGRLKEQKVISKIEKEWKISTFVTIYFPDFFIVKKDPESDCYAVTTSDFRDEADSRPTQIVHYNSDHSEISRQIFKETAGDGKPIKLIDLVVMGQEKLVGLAQIWTKDTVKFMLVDIKKGSTVFTDLNLPEQTKFNTFYAFRYNSAAKKLLLLISGARLT